MTAIEFLEKMKRIHPKTWGSAQICKIDNVRRYSRYDLPQQIITLSVCPTRKFCFYAFPWDYMEETGMVAKQMAYWRYQDRMAHMRRVAAEGFREELAAIDIKIKEMNNRK